jgi:hypothetical protein
MKEKVKKSKSLKKLNLNINTNVMTVKHVSINLFGRSECLLSKFKTLVINNETLIIPFKILVVKPL